MVIEGAPGQGKSTIAQYVCQVHRMKLLEKKESLRFLPKNHLSSPMRIPFKVELRDFALWLSKKNPFSADGKDTTRE